MRILFTTDYYHPHLLGGVERVVKEIATRIAAAGHEVAVLTCHTSNGLPDQEMIDGVRVVRVPALHLTRLIGLQSSVSLKAFSLAASLVREFEPHVVNVHSLFFNTSVAGLLAARAARVPCVATVHLGSLEFLKAHVKALARMYETTVGRWMLKQCACVIAVSELVARHARALAGSERRIFVVPNGVDKQVFRPRSRASTGTRLVYVGRLIQNKGVQYLLRAMPKILSVHPDASLQLVGDGPMRGYLERMANSLGISHAVAFLGIRDDVPDILAEADVFIRPSLTEGMPLAVLEAMSAGLPVVATPVAGVVELVKHGENGLLVPPGDPAALADAVTQLLSDPHRRRSMGSEARRTIERKYSWDRTAQETLAVFRWAVGAYGKMSVQGDLK